MLPQKTAVYNAIKSTLAESGQKHEDFTPANLSKEQRDKVVGILVTGFEKGEIDLKSPQEDLKSYAGGLVTNWLRKDKRLNGGVKYQPSNPGSRTGQADPMVKNLRILLSTLPEDSEAFKATQARIEARVSEIKAEKAKSTSKQVDMDAIPEDIKALL